MSDIRSRAHCLEAQLVDSEGKKLLPDLHALPDRSKQDRARDSRAHGRDEAAGRRDGHFMAALTFPFAVIESLEAIEVLSALDSGGRR